MQNTLMSFGKLYITKSISSYKIELT